MLVSTPLSIPCQGPSGHSRNTLRRPMSLAPKAMVFLTVLGMCTMVDIGEASALRTGWYVSGGIGTTWSPDMNQEGWNQDTFCYPDAACFDEEPIPLVSGYNWFYDIRLDEGYAFELSLGRFFGRARIELALAQSSSEASQTFTGISYLDGTTIQPRPGGTVNSNGRGTIGGQLMRSVSLDAYFDFTDTWHTITPYIGAGLGIASVTMEEIRFSTEYIDAPGAAEIYEPPLSFYNSVQDADLEDSATLLRLHVGLDYLLNPMTSAGLKLTWSSKEDIEVTDGYEQHPMHGVDSAFMNTNAFREMSNWTLALSLRRVIGN